MLKHSSPLWSSVGKKILMALTGLFLVAFLVVHLIGNLTLFSPSPDAINLYAHYLHKVELVILILEVGLGVLFLLHATLAIWTWLQNNAARPVSYQVSKNAGHTSKKTLSSQTMIYTGIVIFIFVILHLMNFKYGPGMEQGYVTRIDGHRIWDLHRIVMEFFSSGWNVMWYMLVMLLLGLHLRHGAWSAFQSLGVNNNWFMRFIFQAAVVVAVIIAGGFFLLPLWIFLNGGAS